MATCRSCGAPTSFLTFGQRDDGRCAHCRMGVDRRDTRWHPHFRGSRYGGQMNDRAQAAVDEWWKTLLIVALAALLVYGAATLI